MIYLSGGDESLILNNLNAHKPQKGNFRSSLDIGFLEALAILSVSVASNVVKVIIVRN